MLNITHFRELVVKPALDHMGLYSEAAENLLVGTALVESKIKHLKQIGNGPALGVFQVEPATHDDIWDNYLKYQPNYRELCLQLLSSRAIQGRNKSSDLVGNLPYAVAIARLVYFRKPQALPHKDDIHGLAQYWKDHYNTHLGAGNPDKFYRWYMEFGT